MDIFIIDLFFLPGLISQIIENKLVFFETDHRAIYNIPAISLRGLSPVSLIFHIKSTVNSCPQLSFVERCSFQRQNIHAGFPYFKPQCKRVSVPFSSFLSTPKTRQSRKQVLDQNKIASFLRFSNDNNSPFISSSLKLLIHASSSFPSPFCFTHTHSTFGQPFKQLVTSF